MPTSSSRSRGLNVVKESDYALLLDNRLGKQRFDGRYVHNDLLSLDC
jgi:hypothetical protein